MSTPDPPPPPILYACVARGPTPLAELSASDDLLPLAARCLAAAPPFHRLYSHTVSGRTHSFLIDASLGLLFFVVSDSDSLPRPDALLFLSRLRDAVSSAPSLRPDDLLPLLRRQITPSPPTPPPPPPPLPPSSPPSDAPLTALTPSESDDGKTDKPPKKTKKGKKRLWSDEAESRMEIPSESGRRTHNADRSLEIGTLSSAHKLWRRHLWRVLLFDLIVCSILFVVWLSVCRGFQCVTG